MGLCQEIKSDIIFYDYILFHHMDILHLLNYVQLRGIYVVSNFLPRWTCCNKHYITKTCVHRYDCFLMLNTEKKNCWIKWDLHFRLYYTLCVCVCVHLVVSDSWWLLDCSPPGSSVHGDSPGKNTGVGCHFLLQRIFPTQGLNPRLLHLLHWQADSFPLAPPGKPLLHFASHNFQEKKILFWRFPPISLAILSHSPSSGLLPIHPL